MSSCKRRPLGQKSKNIKNIKMSLGQNQKLKKIICGG